MLLFGVSKAVHGYIFSNKTLFAQIRDYLSSKCSKCLSSSADKIHFGDTVTVISTLTALVAVNYADCIKNPVGKTYFKQTTNSDCKHDYAT